jgi:demethylmenaquinone methyltransferase/2-methoxy-6-polyprenyl-1,4-benzoquinol methylase
VSDDESTHFGFYSIPAEQKRHRVREVFDSVAERYDLMNDLMSLGLHRLWKRFAVHLSGVRAGDQVLDLAGGTGDLARALLPRVGNAGSVTLADINAAMLRQGRRGLLDQGFFHGLRYVQANAEALPFADRSFDCITMAFGLRNVTDKERAMAEMYRVLRPGGHAWVLEFSALRLRALAPLYDAYSFRVLPWLGERVAGDAESYRYLAESIRMHPGQEELARQMRASGFDECDWFNLSAGVVALHRGTRL